MHVHTHHKSIFQTNTCSYKNMTYLIAPQHLCINAWSYHMHVHGISNKELKRKHNLTCEEQTTTKHGGRDS